MPMLDSRGSRADRLAVVSEDGKPLSDEYTLAIQVMVFMQKKTQETLL
ncbi:MAG: hypothetical protein CM1200mP10_20250 [Candidatus Neomarinimicrobiota bacterium]|nr:MAG: hypothetical protein CM1200mP10_20250 [Candidatus Neomarinimicrobiota bacterium]